jgi:hypothetical protein
MIALLTALPPSIALHRENCFVKVPVWLPGPGQGTESPEPKPVVLAMMPMRMSPSDRLSSLWAHDQFPYLISPSPLFHLRGLFVSRLPMFATPSQPHPHSKDNATGGLLVESNFPIC